MNLGPRRTPGILLEKMVGCRDRAFLEGRKAVSDYTEAKRGGGGTRWMTGEKVLLGTRPNILLI